MNSIIEKVVSIILAGLVIFSYGIAEADITIGLLIFCIVRMWCHDLVYVCKVAYLETTLELNNLGDRLEHTDRITVWNLFPRSRSEQK